MSKRKKNQPLKLIHRAYKYRIYPTAQQARLFNQTIGCARLIYNKALAERTRAWTQEQRRVSYEDTAKMLTAWKKDPELAFLKDVSNIALQQSLRHLQSAFVKFWGKSAKYPTFKSKKRPKQSFSLMDNGFRFNDAGQFFVAKSKEPLTVVFHRPLPVDARISSITISKDGAGRWFISMLTETQAPEPKSVIEREIGIDFGVKTLATFSDGTRITNPRIGAQNATKLARAQRNLARKQKGSANWYKAKGKLARIYAKIADTRKDFTHKLSRKIVDENQVIYLEDLNLVGMTASARGSVAKPGKNVAAKTGLNRAILDVGIGELVQQIQYKADWAGRRVVKIDRFYPSSKQCSACGALKPMPLSERTYRCANPQCALVLDRDVNAAKNILVAGRAVAACGDGLRLTHS